MIIEKIGTRGILFTFELIMDNFIGTVNVYLINTEHYIFICDTFTGPNAMNQIISYIKLYFEQKPIIIFNSHSDFDHFWGNCAFKDSIIISSNLCRKNILQPEQIKFLKENKNLQSGDVSILPPNLTFQQKLLFPSEDIYFFCSPGHTKDSASCYDKLDEVLFAGDNVEEPIPYLNYPNLEDYISSLNYYLKLSAKIIIPGHGQITNDLLIKKNLEYIYDLQSGNTRKYESGKYRSIHQQNMGKITEIKK
ncbi:MAG: Zn-dependent hydrolase [Bacteroidetes bacterium]|nr:MAG: Zn-dependent hydrolase [Bacteroidota bacterium]